MISCRKLLHLIGFLHPISIVLSLTDHPSQSGSGSLVPPAGLQVHRRWCLCCTLPFFKRHKWRRCAHPSKDTPSYGADLFPNIVTKIIKCRTATHSQILMAHLGRPHASTALTGRRSAAYRINQVVFSDREREQG